MTKRHICFVQMHYTDLKVAESSKHNLINKIKQSGVFDEIVLGVADIPENDVVVEFASKYKVHCYKGHINNTVDRMLGAVNKYNADYLYRVLLNWHYIDLDLIVRMKAIIQNDQTVDYVMLPYDFDIRFGCDLLSKNCLIKLSAIVNNLNENDKHLVFRPWYILENDPNIKRYIIEDVPTYGNEYFYELRAKILETSPTAWNYGESFNYADYVNFSKHLKSTDLVLDLSCGYGYGTVSIADKCAKIVGFDVLDEHIDYASAIVEKKQLKNVEFVIGGKDNLPFENNFFDKVISIHTMEHVEHDKQFVDEIYRVLKPGGELLITVPIRIRKPFIHNDEPLIIATSDYPGHYREYTYDSFIDMFKGSFSTVEIYGVNRGVYVEFAKARNAIVGIFKKG